MTNHLSNRRQLPKHHITDLWTVLTRYVYHWPLFVLGAGLSIAAGIFYLKITKPVYGISATILVKDEKKSPREKSALQELNQSSAPNNAESEIQIIKSRGLIAAVVNDLQLWTVYTKTEGMTSRDIYQAKPFTFTLLHEGRDLTGQKLSVTILDDKRFEFTDPDGARKTAAFGKEVSSHLGRWAIEPARTLHSHIGSTINIAFNDPDKTSNAYMKALDVHLLDKLAPTIGLFINDEVPTRGKDVLNHIINQYNILTAAEEKRTTKSTIDFIDSRLASLTGELNNAEKEVEGFRTSEGLTDINSQSKVYLENVQMNDSKLNEVNVQLNVLSGVEQYVNSSPANQNAPAMVGIADPALNNLVEKLSQLQLKRVALLATTPEKNPEFIPINDQIRETRAGIKENIQGIKSGLLSTKRELQSFNNKFESSIRNIPGQERQFVGMKRQQAIKENLYVYLLQKREEMALSYAGTVSDARIVDYASVGDVVWPRLPLVGALAVIFGLGLPFLVIYFRHSFNRKITGRNEIEEALAIPIIGELSYQEAGGNIVLTNETNPMISEQFRSIRTNLHYLHQQNTGISVNRHERLADHTGIPAMAGSVSRWPLEEESSPAPHGRVTLVTSSVSNEGKSFVSSNLAVSIAASGKKTVILEMDLRKPKISAMFKLPSRHPGITDFLSSGRLSSEDITQASAVANLDVIGCGAIADNPSELLSNGGLEKLIDDLRPIYDDIIIDTPPIHLVTDAMIIAMEANVSLYLIRQGVTGKNELDFISEIHDEDKLPNMRIVFNGINKAKYGYGYGFDTSYYYTGKTKPASRASFKTFLSRF
ncbi:GumC family protein [Hufsiella ginkgonis]|uniref:Polysaccharide biosynthesis tyrosine autokinase n=1 Tax=Hufsiella ginkgonis TaxID=2695274 RepID=A0A7K1XXR9_9SPHI|nr:polysaccharide biosynthesis tyrosine autokinase [Hufsiella ginkgonis]MXV15790.1 polysaccharide biosynthesis tyrosine autokinase [Hufsiella ginkgonis]